MYMYVYMYMYMYMYILVTMHEETMLTERTRAHDARRVESQSFFLQIVSLRLSLAARACSSDDA